VGACLAGGLLLRAVRTRGAVARTTER
jgi:hypothetical protein